MMDDLPTTGDMGESLLGAVESRPSWVAPSVVPPDPEAAPLSNSPTTMDPANAVGGGEAQPRRFRDAWAALLFLVQQGIVLYLAFAWGWPIVHHATATATQGIASTGSYGATFSLLFSIAALALIMGTLLLTALVKVAAQLLSGALLATAATQALLAVWLVWEGYWVASLVPLVLWLMTGLYARAVWHRIPMAAVHLQTSLQAVQHNGSLVLVALAMSVGLMLWIAIWLLAFCGIYFRSLSLQDGQAHLNGLVVLLLVLSLFWTVEVSRNVVHVTVSGTVGTWWFCPDEANQFASPAVRNSWYRSLTYSFGSICVGSLLAALLTLLHRMAHSARRQSSSSSAASLLLCVVECLSRCTERLLTYFNKWAFVYVGLYGYDYLSAGQKVLVLFRERGWTTIIQDDLIVRCLQFVTLGLGCLTGVLGVWMTTLHPSWMAVWQTDEAAQLSKKTMLLAFGVCFALGTAVGHLLMSVVESAVDTVLVTWAEAPLELERHYPGLYASQVAAWRQAYPREFGM